MQGEAPDFALPVDGLAAEREQRITIDVAHRYFATDKRKFIIADYCSFADGAGIGEVTAIPMSGLSGDNVAARTTAMPWC